MKPVLPVIILLAFSHKGFTQNVGIGTSNPVAGLHMINNNGILSKGVFESGAILNETGAGAKFIWYPRKGALRAGVLDDGGFEKYWENDSIGEGSLALGINVKAKGWHSTAIGEHAETHASRSFALGTLTFAHNDGSFAIGNITSTLGEQSLAIGNGATTYTLQSIAIGTTVSAGISIPSGGGFDLGFQGQPAAVAIGFGSIEGYELGSHFASGQGSFSIGNNCRVYANKAFCIGNDNVAPTGLLYSGEYGFSVGNNCRASNHGFAIGNSCDAGAFSFAIGNNAKTTGRIGSFVLGSRVDGIAVNSPGDFHFLAQFANGYQLQSNTAGTLGVFLNPNTSSWGSLCDSTKKEQVIPMDDEATLEKLAAVNYSSWKYKDDPVQTNRHYGIMAQDFYAAFGKDELGTIGNDTLVDPINLLGVAYSAIKALEKRTKQYEAENARLQSQLERLEGKLAELQQDVRTSTLNLKRN